MNINFKKEIAKDSLAQHNVIDSLKDSSIEVRRAVYQKTARPFSVACINITGDLNIGNIIRSANLFGAQDVFLFGRKKYDKRSTVGAENYMNLHVIECLNNDLTIDADLLVSTITNKGYNLFYIEQFGVDINKYSFPSYYKNNFFMGDPCLVFGNEGRGIPDYVINNNVDNKIHYRKVLSIPQVGIMRSHNVGNAASIVMYELARQMGWI